MKEKEGEKKEQQIDRCQREAERDGESSLPRKILRPSPSGFLASSAVYLHPSRAGRGTARLASLVLLVAHLEARQMSGIRLRHLSVSPFVTFDSGRIVG